jgi:RNA polymerase sigma-70 factor (ECF subfamily)
LFEPSSRAGFHHDIDVFKNVRTSTDGSAVDRRLIEQAQAGDRQAFTELAGLVSDRLFGLALRMLRDRDAAGDVLQTSLVQIWRDLPNLREVDRFDAWAYRVVVNCCRNTWRRGRRSLVTIELSPSDVVVGDTQAAVARRDELERAFGKLTHDQRAVLVLLYYEDLPVAEAAAVLGLRPGTVKSRAHYARESLRAALSAEARTTPPEGRPA